MNRTFTICFFLIAAIIWQAFPALAGEQVSVSNSRSFLFIENKGQIIDTDGNVHNDILFVADLPSKKVYFRQTGISYVLSKYEEANQTLQGFETHEELNLIHLPCFQNLEGVTSDSENKSSVFLYRIDSDFINSNPSPNHLQKRQIYV